jgi:hypothetical protein
MRSLLISLIVGVGFVACNNQKNDLIEDQLDSVKKEFVKTIFSSGVEEGPFAMSYQLETIFFSKDVISLFGVLNVHDCMPHGRRHYEGKTYVREGDRFKEVSLDDLFPFNCQKEFLKKYCERICRNNSIGYFEGNNPLKASLDVKDIQTFVIDERSLIIIFQSYVVGGGEDGPFFVKIPFKYLEGYWDPGNIMLPVLHEIIASKQFVSSSDEIFGVSREDGLT